MPSLVSRNEPLVQRQPSASVNNVGSRPINVKAELAKSVESGAEERTFGIKRNRSEFEQHLEEEYSDSQRKLRRKKVKEIQRIQSLLLPHQKPQDLANRLRGNSESQAGLNEVYARSYADDQGPVMILAAIEVAEQSQSLSDRQKENLNEFKDRLIDQHSTEILSWKVSVDGVREKVKSPELADSVLQLIGRSNTQQPSYLQTFIDILDVAGQENFKSVSNAYVGALNEDTKKSVASTNHGYLSETLGKMSKFSKASIMFSQAEDAVAKLVGRFGDVEKDGVDFFRAALQIMGSPDKKNVGNIATGFMGLGDRRKQEFTSQISDFLKNIPTGIWECDDHKFGTLGVLAQYSSGGNRWNLSKEKRARRKWNTLA